MKADLPIRDLTYAMQVYGAKEYPKEACGLVLAHRTGKTEIVRCTNTHEFPTKMFRIGRIEHTQHADRAQVIGIWHTHPEGHHTFTDADKAGCEVGGVPWYVMQITKEGENFVYGEVQSMQPSGFKMAYTGRPYVPGIFDCWTLAIDYFAREHSIALRNYPYTLPDGTPGATLFAKHYQDEGFVQLINEEPKPSDLFFIQDAGSDEPNHVAIYVGDDRMLHHSLNRLSKHDIYGGYYQKHTVIHARHRELMR